MEHHPNMQIRIPPAKEEKLHEEMKKRVTPPWSPQDHDPFGRPVKSGYLYFHRDIVGDEPSCTVCIYREEEGSWAVNIIPDEGQGNRISIEQFKRMLNTFDSEIACPAAEALGGITAIGVSEYRLKDYFSPEAVGLLECFCKTSNASDLGAHPDDQKKWIAFLLRVHDDGSDVHCDDFGGCLRTAEWWPADGIPDLVREYDFAMRLLKQSER